MEDPHAHDQTIQQTTAAPADPQPESLSRRGFLGTALAAGALLGTAGLGGCARSGGITILPRHVLGGRPRYLSPNEKINLAWVGIGGKGEGDVGGLSAHNFVAFCEVDKSRAAKTIEAHPNVPIYADWREMLDRHAGQIDAVGISTPDHLHAPIAMEAMRRGKHVYVQKPMAHTVAEARAMTEMARKMGVVSMMGIQGHSSEGTRLVHEWIAQGKIGKVHEVKYWTNRPIWPQNIARPRGATPLPTDFNWDLWLGPAPWRPFVEEVYHPFAWRGWWDFGCGALGDIGCHAFTAAYWALNLGQPTSVYAESSGMTADSAPAWSIVTYEFPARGEMPPVKLTWYDGDRKPERPKELEEGRELPDEIGGQLILGDDGAIMADTYCNSPRIIPEARMKEVMSSKPEKTLRRSPGHYEEFIQAIQGDHKPGPDFDFSGPMTEVVLLGNLAVRLGREVQWDGVKMQVKNDPEANALLTKKYRKGFEI